jgi:hypothetical protein
MLCGPCARLLVSALTPPRTSGPPGPNPARTCRPLAREYPRAGLNLSHRGTCGLAVRVKCRSALSFPSACRHADPDTPHTALHGPCGFFISYSGHTPPTRDMNRTTHARLRGKSEKSNGNSKSFSLFAAPASAPNLAVKVDTNVLVARRLTPDRTTYATGFRQPTVSGPKPDFPRQTPAPGYPSPSGVRGSASTPFVLTGKRFPASRG